MATRARTIRLVAAIALLTAGARGLPAEGAAPEGDFFYSIGDDGKPVFTQILRWEADENALEFEFALRRREAGAEPVETLRERTMVPEKEVQLAPGAYDYRITAYNLLGKPEGETDWIALDVAKAEMPSISGLEPAIIYLDDQLDSRVIVRGEKLMPGCKVFLVDGEASFQGVEKLRKGDEEIVVVFPEGAYRGGEYDVEVENPGKLKAVKEGGLRIRAALPAPGILAPPRGFSFGAAELKARRSIELSWAPVDGATGYGLALYAKGGTEPIVLKEDLRETRYTIEDLSLLDRGDFTWKVEAFARDDDGLLDRKGFESSSAFSIQLPRVKKAESKAEGEYFGH